MSKAPVVNQSKMNYTSAPAKSVKTGSQRSLGAALGNILSPLTSAAKKSQEDRDRREQERLNNYR